MTMRKVIIIVLSITILLLSPPISHATVPSSAILDSMHTNRTEYKYPITPESDDWFAYTVLEKIEMLRIPNKVLTDMNNEDLISAIMSYPYLVDIYLYGDNVGDGIDTSRHYFSALDELLSRDDGLADLYNQITQFISRSSQQRSELDTALLSFADKALLDIYLSQTSDTSRNTYDEPIRPYPIYTPAGTAIIAYVYNDAHTRSEHQRKDIDEIVNVYGVTLVSPGSCKFNCHYYAWHLKGNVAMDIYARLNDPSMYMTDGSYTRVYNGGINTWHYETNIQMGDIIFYGVINGDPSTMHSAIFNYDSITGGPIASTPCLSKWGHYGVFEHAMGNVPAGYDIAHISAWRLALDE